MDWNRNIRLMEPEVRHRITKNGPQTIIKCDRGDYLDIKAAELIVRHVKENFEAPLRRREQAGPARCPKCSAEMEDHGKRICSCPAGCGQWVAASRPTLDTQ